MNAVAIPKQELAERLKALAREAHDLADAFPEDGVDGPLGLMCSITERVLRDAHKELSVEGYKWSKHLRFEAQIVASPRL